MLELTPDATAEISCLLDGHSTCLSPLAHGHGAGRWQVREEAAAAAALLEQAAAATAGMERQMAALQAARQGLPADEAALRGAWRPGTLLLATQFMMMRLGGQKLCKAW